MQYHNLAIMACFIGGHLAIIIFGGIAPVQCGVTCSTFIGYSNAMLPEIST